MLSYNIFFPHTKNVCGKKFSKVEKISGRRHVEAEHRLKNTWKKIMS